MEWSLVWIFLNDLRQPSPCSHCRRASFYSPATNLCGSTVIRHPMLTDKCEVNGLRLVSDRHLVRPKEIIIIPAQHKVLVPALMQQPVPTGDYLLEPLHFPGGLLLAFAMMHIIDGRTLMVRIINLSSRQVTLRPYHIIGKLTKPAGPVIVL